MGMTTLAPRDRPSSRPVALLSVASAVVLGMCFIPRADHAARDFGAAVAAMQEAKTLHVTGWVRQTTGSFAFALFYLALSLAAAGVLVLTLRRRR